MAAANTKRSSFIRIGASNSGNALDGAGSRERRLRRMELQVGGNGAGLLGGSRAGFSLLFFQLVGDGAILHTLFANGRHWHTARAFNWIIVNAVRAVVRAQAAASMPWGLGHEALVQGRGSEAFGGGGHGTVGTLLGRSRRNSRH